MPDKMRRIVHNQNILREEAIKFVTKIYDALKTKRHIAS